MNEMQIARSRPDRVGSHLAVILVAPLIASCGREPPPVPAVARPVKILEIGSSAGGSFREYPGVVRAADSADVSFEVPGRIIRLDAQQGADVEAGEVLGQLDDADYRAELDVALANLRKAQSDLQRSKSVFEQDPGAITPQRIDADRRSVDVAQARVAQARKAVDDTVLKAPFRGVVSRRLVEVFENVQAKQPVIVVDSLNAMEVEINVPERDMVIRERTGRPRAEDLEEVSSRVNPVVRISALPNEEFPARLTEIATRADPATRTFAIRLSFDAPPEVALLPGMTARVKARFGEGQTINIPLSAVVATPGAEPKVWVVDPANMTVSGRIVELGAMAGAEVEVLSGLEPGEMIATTGITQLAEGMAVTRFEGTF